MKIIQFIELPISNWNGRDHVSSEQLINMDEVLHIVPNGKWKQTIIKLKNGKEEFVNEYYADVKELIESQLD